MINLTHVSVQYFGHLMRRVDSLEKTDAGRDWGQEEKGMTEDEMVGWHHRLNGVGGVCVNSGCARCESWNEKHHRASEPRRGSRFKTKPVFGFASPARLYFCTHVLVSGTWFFYSKVKSRGQGLCAFYGSIFQNL